MITVGMRWDPWLDGKILKSKFGCLFYLTDNKMATLAEKLGSGGGGY